MGMAITVDNSQDFWTKIRTQRGQYQLILTRTSSALLGGQTVSHHNYIRVLCPFFAPETGPLISNAHVHSAAGEVPSHL